MATTNPSLFGMLGDEEAMQRQLDEARAAKFAEQTQEQRFASMGYGAGAALGRGVASLFGVDTVDPVVRQASQVRQLASQFDTTTPEGMMQFAQAVKNINPNMALQAAQQARDMQVKIADIAQKTASAAASMMDKLTPEQRNAAASADTKADRGTPEWTKIYSEELARLTTKEGSKPTVVGVAEGTKQPVYSDGAQQFVYARGPDGTSIKQPYFGGVDRTTAKVSATATSGDKGRTAFSEQLGKLDAARVNDAQSARDNAVATLNSLNRLSSLDDQGLISGSFATGRVGATNLLATLGLASDTDQRRLASSENYQKVAGDVILGTLGGKLGAGFSNEDRKFIQSLVPQLENSPAARRQLIDFMTRKNQDIVAEATRLENYARDNEGLKGFQPKIPFKAVPASSMSPEELAKAAGGKIVNGVFVKDK